MPTAEASSTSYAAPMPWSHRDWTALFALVALAALFLCKVLFLGQCLLPSDLLLLMSPWREHARELFPQFHQVYNPMLDVIQQYYPWRQFWAESVRHGVLPLWNPHMFCGTPFISNSQSAVLYPLNFLFLLMPVKSAFGWTAFLHLCLAGCGTYVFLRSVTGSRAGSLAGAVVFMFCGFLVAWMEFTTFLCTASHLPWALYLMDRALQRRDAGHAVLAGLPLGLACLAGHPQIALYVVLAAGLYGAYRCGERVLAERRATVAAHALFLLVVALLTGLALGAVQLLPVYELAHASTRGGGFDFQHVFGARFPLFYLVTLLVPDFFGNPVDYNFWAERLFHTQNFIELSGYAGLLPLIAVPFCFHKEIRARAMPFLCLLTLSLLLAAATPLYRLFVFLVPGFSQITGSSRMVFLVDFALACLVACFIRFLSEERRAEQTKRVLAGVWLMAAVAGAAVGAALLRHADIVLSDQVMRPEGFGDRETFFAYTVTQLRIFAVLLISSCSAITAVLLGRRCKPMVRLLPAAVVATDLFLYGFRYNPATPREMAYFRTPSIEKLLADQRREPLRFLAVGESFLRWTPSNCLMTYGLSDVQGSDSLWSARYARFLHCIEPTAPTWRFGDPSSKLLDLAAVTHFLVPGGMAFRETPGVRRVFAGDMEVYQNMDALPRASVVSNERRAANDEEVLVGLSDPSYRPSREAIVLARSASNVPVLDNPSTAGAAAVTSYQANSLSLQVQAKRASWVRLSDAYYPWWRAALDAKPVEVACLDAAFRGVRVPAGRHIVQFSAVPTSVRLGEFVSLLALLLVAAASAWVSGRCGLSQKNPDCASSRGS